MDIKAYFKNTYKQKYIIAFSVMYAVFSLLKNFIPDKTTSIFLQILNFILIFLTVLPLGYSINNFYKKFINENEQYKNFKETFMNAFITALKFFVALFANILIYISCFGVTVLITVLALYRDLKLTFFTNPLLIFLFIILFVIGVIYYEFVTLVYAERRSIKDTFNWVKVFKFYFKNFKKNTIVVLSFLGLCILTILLTISISMISVLFLSFVIKFVTVPYAKIIFDVCTILTLAVMAIPAFSFIFYIMNVHYDMLIDIYKEQIISKNSQTDDQINDQQKGE